MGWYVRYVTLYLSGNFYSDLHIWIILCKFANVNKLELLLKKLIYKLMEYEK